MDLPKVKEGNWGIDLLEKIRITSSFGTEIV